MAYVPFSQHSLNGAQWFMPQFCTKAQNVPLLIHRKARRPQLGLTIPSRPGQPSYWSIRWYGRRGRLTKAQWRCRQCSLLSSLVIQIPVVNAVGLVDQKSFLILLRRTAFLQQHLLIRSYVDEVFCSRNAFGTTANNSMIIFALPHENMFGKINMSDV